MDTLKIFCKIKEQKAQICEKKTTLLTKGVLEEMSKISAHELEILSRNFFKCIHVELNELTFYNTYDDEEIKQFINVSGNSNELLWSYKESKVILNSNRFNFDKLFLLELERALIPCGRLLNSGFFKTVY